MPPGLALLLTLGFISVMLWRDARKSDHVSRALWLPVIWIFVVGSKFLGQWLSLLGFSLQAPSQEDGSPIDSIFFLALILGGVIVLAHRRVSPFRFLRNNVWLTVFLVYCFLAITWSDFPFVAFRRWIKVLGHPVMALIVLSDPAPEEALRSTFRRSSYLLIPLSILFIKYYPQYGRGFDSWTGAATNVGIMNSKNELGYVCMLVGLFYFWNVLAARNIARRNDRYEEMVLSGAFLWMIWWLFSMVNSATAVGCLAIGAATMMVVNLRFVSKRFIGTYVVAAFVVLAGAETSFGIYGQVLELLRRDPTLTDRTAIWQDVLAIDDSPILGAGFESFWLGPRLQRMWAKWWWHPIQAHNGYIETYLSLGGVGVLLLAGLLVATFRKSRRELLRNLDLGRFRLGFLFVIVAYNYTEATFKGVHLVWTVFYLIAIDYQAPETVGAHAGPVLPARHVDGVRRDLLPAAWRPANARAQTRNSLSSSVGSGPTPPAPGRRS